jgi:DNA-binding MarR family transcriptional regulator
MAKTQSTASARPRDHGADVGHDARYEDAEAVVSEIVRFFRMMKRMSARFASQKRDGIEQAAYFLLAVLVTEGPQRTTSLAEAVHSDTSTVSRQVGALVRHGLVERQADPADGRACLLAATPRGQECFDDERRRRTEQIADVLAHWSSEDLRTVSTLLDRLNTDFERHDTPQHTGAHGAAAQLKGGTQ